MQLHDKLVDGREAAHAESQQRADVLEMGEEALPAPMALALPGAALERRGQLLGAIRMILDRQTLEVSDLHLPQRESRALDALQVAVSGRSSDLWQFVYATDRRDLLEQALAVLQPDLIHADDQTSRELHAQLADLAERVGELRHTLTGLEDAQGELLGDQQAALERSTTDPSAAPKPTPSDPDAPRPPTTLTGPELPEPPAPATTLTGPELPELPAPPTTLMGPELPELPAPPTTLMGPELAPAAAPASSLGDAGELAERAKLPWWRGPFG